MIREATIDDIHNILPLSSLFSKSLGVGLFEEKYSDRHAATLLASCVNNGVLLVAERDDKIVGVAGGIISNNIWNPTVKQIDEIIYFVLPEHRNTTVAYRLIKGYGSAIQKLDVHTGTMKLMHNSPDIGKHYAKLGFNELETSYVWIKGG